MSGLQPLAFVSLWLMERATLLQLLNQIMGFSQVTTGPLPEEPFNLFQRSAPDLDGTEKDAEDTSNGLDTSRTYNRSGVEEDDDLSTIEELLFGARNAQEWQKTGSSDRHVTGGSEGNLKDAQQEADGIDVQTYDNLTPDGGDKEREVVRPDKSIGTHDNDTDTNGFTAL